MLFGKGLYFLVVDIKIEQRTKFLYGKKVRLSTLDEKIKVHDSGNVAKN